MSIIIRDITEEEFEKYKQFLRERYALNIYNSYEHYLSIMHPAEYYYRTQIRNANSSEKDNK